jgi:hypothetical protein
LRASRTAEEPPTYPFSSGHRIVSRTSSLKRLFFRIVGVFTVVCG